MPAKKSRTKCLTEARGHDSSMELKVMSAELTFRVRVDRALWNPERGIRDYEDESEDVDVRCRFKMAMKALMDLGFLKKGKNE